MSSLRLHSQAASLAAPHFVPVSAVRRPAGARAVADVGDSRAGARACALARATLQAGGNDNVTAVVVSSTASPNPEMN